MTREEFIALFPEFTPTNSAVVEAHLAAAEAFVADTWESGEADLLVALTAADSIATSPLGRKAGLADPKTGISTYGIRLQKLQESHACCLLRNG